VPYHELDAVTDEFVGHRHALLRIGHVVPWLDFDLLTQDAACLIDVLGRLLDSLGQLGAEGRVGPGDGSRNADFDLRMRRASEPERQPRGMDLRSMVCTSTSHIRLTG
jgi:hypothetical protein